MKVGWQKYAKNPSFLTLSQWAVREGINRRTALEMARTGRLKPHVKEVDFVIQMQGVPEKLKMTDLS